MSIYDISIFDLSDLRRVQLESFTEFLCFKLGTTARKLQKYYNERLSRYGITIAQSFIILSLIEKGPSNVKDLAARLEIDSSAITGLVDRLEREGLVTRQTNPKDRRAFLINLTEKGEKLGQKLKPIASEFNEKIKSGLSKSELNAVLKFFSVMEEIDSKGK